MPRPDVMKDLPIHAECLGPHEHPLGAFFTCGGCAALHRRDAYRRRGKAFEGVQASDAALVDIRSPGNQDVLRKLQPGEPAFIVIGRDPCMVETMKFWCSARRDALARGVLGQVDVEQELAHIAQVEQSLTPIKEWSIRKWQE